MSTPSDLEFLEAIHELSVQTSSSVSMLNKLIERTSDEPMVAGSFRAIVELLQTQNAVINKLVELDAEESDYIDERFALLTAELAARHEKKEQDNG